MPAGTLQIKQMSGHTGSVPSAGVQREDQCMHCEDPGCLRACPADGAIVQYTNGIVDFQQENCIGCQYCVSGCPFDIPKFNSQTKKVYKCTLCSDRVGQGLEPACIKACPTGCLKFGTKADMRGLAEARARQLREHSGFSDAGVYDPASVSGTHVIYVLHDITKPELYGGLPSNPRIPVMSWTGDDTRWMRRLKDYVANTDTREPEYVDFFNAGQKVYFWAIVTSAIVFLVSGIAMWFPQTFGRPAAAIGYVLHDIAALAMLVGFIVHVYEGTPVAPGTLRSMIPGDGREALGVDASSGVVPAAYRAPLPGPSN